MDLDYENDNGKKHRYLSETSSWRTSKTVYFTLDPNVRTHKFEVLGVTRLLPSKYNTKECICKISYIDSFSIERIVDLAPSISTLAETYSEDSDFKINQFTSLKL